MKDEDAAKALKEIDDILEAEKPYGRIKDAGTLISRVEEVNKARLKQRRDHAIEKIDEHIGQVKAELDEVGAAPELRNKCLHPLQSLKSGIEAEESIAHIFQLQGAARDAADDAFAAIEEAARKVTPVPSGSDAKAPTTEPGGEPAVKKATSKKRRIVEPSQIAGATYLETKEDVDGFLNSLRKELEEAIDNNERVEIR